jgi:hypothetical protein
MTTAALGCQFIADAVGNPVGVILPLEKFALVEDTLNQRLPVSGMADKLVQMEQAANDDLFMNDLLRKEKRIAFKNYFFERWARTTSWLNVARLWIFRRKLAWFNQSCDTQDVFRTN